MSLQSFFNSKKIIKIPYGVNNFQVKTNYIDLFIQKISLIKKSLIKLEIFAFLKVYLKFFDYFLYIGSLNKDFYSFVSMGFPKKN